MQSGTSGTLTVGNGTPATTADITLLGNYIAGNFHIQSDGARRHAGHRPAGVGE
jgi:hypothetical protein